MLLVILQENPPPPPYLIGKHTIQTITKKSIAKKHAHLCQKGAKGKPKSNAKGKARAHERPPHEQQDNTNLKTKANDKSQPPRSSRRNPKSQKRIQKAKAKHTNAEEQPPRQAKPSQAFT